jgi:hypothetical protein
MHFSESMIGWQLVYEDGASFINLAFLSPDSIKVSSLTGEGPFNRHYVWVEFDIK